MGRSEGSDDVSAGAARLKAAGLGESDHGATHVG